MRASSRAGGGSSNGRGLNWTAASIITAAAMGLMTSPAQADTINVPGDQPTIQDGIDAAINGDEVVVAAGEYFESIDFSGKLITVRSSSGAASTRINATGTGQPAVRFDTFETAAAVLEGFEIVNGTGVPTAIGFGISDVGAGIYIDDASPTINDCIVQSNDTDRGGGLFCSDGAPTINNTVFTINTATECGGAVWLLNSDATFSGCEFDNNDASGAGAGGGGVGMSGGSPTFDNCRFTDNTADGSGGGAHVVNSTATFIGCMFLDNTASLDGGGMWINGQDWPRVENSSFINNSANSGGGVHIRFFATGGPRGAGDTKFINCQFLANIGFAVNTAGSTNNGGGAIAAGVNARVDITNCSIVGNRLTGNGARGGGISVVDTALEVRLVNTVLWGNFATLAANTLEAQIRISPPSNPAVNVNYCCIDDGAPGGTVPFGGAANNNIDENPAFADPNGADEITGTEDDDVSLTETSSCRNAGDNGAPDLAGITSDLGGDVRIIEEIVDIGCYEYRPFCSGDADGDLDVDLDDLLLIIGTWGSDGSGGGDLTGDGLVGLDDLLQVIARWGATCDV